MVNKKNNNKNKGSNSFMIILCLAISLFVFLSFLSYIDDVKRNVINYGDYGTHYRYDECVCENLFIGSSAYFYYSSSYALLAYINTVIFYILFMILGYFSFKEKMDYKTTLKYAILGALIAVVLISIYMINFEHVLDTLGTNNPLRYCVEQCSWHFNVLLDGYLIPMIGAILLALIWSTLGYYTAKYKSQI